MNRSSKRPVMSTRTKARQQASPAWVDKVLTEIVGANFRSGRQTGDLPVTLSTVEWARFLETKEVRGLLPLIFYTLRRQSLLKIVPAGSTKYLRKAYLTMAARNLLMLRELRRILAALEEQAVNILLFKGAALAESVYPDFALRPMADLDLLVRNKRDMERVAGVMGALGYGAEHLERPDVFADSVVYETTFRNVRDKWMITDIHHTLPYLGGKRGADGLSNTERIWENGVLGNIGGHQVWLMSREDAIVNLIAHELIQHHSDRFLLYSDLGFIVTTGTIDWSKLISKLCGSPAAAPVAEVLDRASTEFHVPIPSSVISDVNDINGQAGVFRRTLASDSTIAHVNFLDSLAEAPSLLKKSTLVARYLLPSRTYMRQAYQIRLTSHLVWFYLRRPIFIILRSARLLWKARLLMAKGGNRGPR